MPLSEDGAIDTATLEAEPARATVRRHWANEADMLGYLVRSPMGYAIRYEMSGADSNGHGHANGSSNQRLFQFGADAIRIGEQIFLTEPDGRKLRFRIAGMQ